METLSSPLSDSLVAAVSWLVIAALAMVPADNAFFARRLAFPLGTLIGLALAGFGLQAIWLHAAQLTLPLGNTSMDMPATPDRVWRAIRARR